MKRIKFFITALFLINSVAQLNGAARKALKPKKNAEGKTVVIFVHNSDEAYTHEHFGSSEILTSDIVAALKDLKNDPAYKNILVHQVDEIRDDASKASIKQLIVDYIPYSPKKVTVVFPENHTLSFKDEIDDDEERITTGTRGIDLGAIGSTAGSTIQANPEQAQSALQGAMTIGSIIKQQHSEMEAMPETQRPKWYQRLGMCLCAAARDPKVQAGAVAAGTIAVKIAMTLI
ncbi:hypothetical protein K2X40_03365 [Candidatus Babeliales bacterium]|nr:hypothetical protein [Candidatus Babeliales bacterium]